MKRIAIIALITLGALSFGAAAQLFDEQIEEILETIGLSKFRETTTDADRKSVISYLRQRGFERLNWPQSSFEKALIEFGDEAMIDEYTKRFAHDPSRIRDELVRSRSPRVIEAAIPILFKEEPYEYYSGDVPMVPPSYYVASNTIPLILANSPAFNEDVINWALSFLAGDRAKVFGTGKNFWSGQRDLFRQWWRDNEQDFRSKDYKAVRPPPGQIPEYIRPEAPATAVQTTAPAALPKPAAPVVEVSSATVEQRAPLWPWVVAGIIVLIVIAALALKRCA